MGKNSTKRGVSLVKSSDIARIVEIDTIVINSGGKLVELKICKINQPVGLIEIFASKEKTLNPKLIADFCSQYEKFLPYAKNSFFFLAENKTGCSVLELYKSCNKLESEAYDINDDKILSEGTRIVLVA